MRPATVITHFAGRDYCLGPFTDSMIRQRTPNELVDFLWYVNLPRHEAFCQRLEEVRDHLTLRHGRKIRIVYNHRIRPRSNPLRLVSEPFGKDHDSVVTQLHKASYAHVHGQRDVIFWEDDMVPGHDALSTLMAVATSTPYRDPVAPGNRRDVAVVGAKYVLRERPGDLAAWMPNRHFAPRCDWPIPVGWIGFGFTWISGPFLRTLERRFETPFHTTRLELPDVRGNDAVLCCMARREGWGVVMDGRIAVGHVRGPSGEILWP